MPLFSRLAEKLQYGGGSSNPAGFGGVQPTDFGATAGISIYDPTRRGGGGEPSPWREPGKGEPGFGGTPAPAPGSESTPTPESQPQTFFERFPTPQDAWKDWLSRMGQFLARQPGEVPNFPGPWGPRTTPASRVPESVRGLHEGADELRTGTRGDERSPGPFEGIGVF